VGVCNASRVGDCRALQTPLAACVVLLPGPLVCAVMPDSRAASMHHFASLLVLAQSRTAMLDYH
jgi:hypothetical protein